MRGLEEIEADLLRPGAPFETLAATVLGAPVRVFRDRPASLRALLERSAAYGDAEYLVWEGRRLTFAEHARQVASVAAALRQRFGVGPGDRVAILAANRPEWIVTFWAAVSLGAIAVALNGWWAGAEIAHGLEDAEPRLLVGDAPRLARLAGRRLALPVVEMERDFAALAGFAPDAALPDVPLAEDDPAVILYTSGTTGRARGAVHTHRNVGAYLRLGAFHGARLLLWLAARGVPPPPPLPPCALVSTPLFHVSGLYAGAVVALAHGIKTVWTAGRFDAGRVLELVERERVTNWGPMGTMVHRLLRHPDAGRRDLSSLRVVGSGGAPLSRELQAAMCEAFPNARASLGIGYGLTESTALLTLIAGAELEAHPDSVGRPLPTVELEIRDDAGRALREGEEGEICARGPMVMRGYWRDPAATAAALAPGRWLRTGDVGRLASGRLFVNARRRDLILRGGENVYPAEIEQCLEAHPDVGEAAVVGVDHPELGQEVKAIVVPAPGRRPEPGALAEFVRGRLAAFKVPVHWELREAPLPRNAAGKVMKPVLVGEGESPFAEEGGGP
jgi:acyl-CoA synthetase (AMP-forming)/AMP-acid ligase II